MQLVFVVITFQMNNYLLVGYLLAEHDEPRQKLCVTRGVDLLRVHHQYSLKIFQHQTIHKTTPRDRR